MFDKKFYKMYLQPEEDGLLIWTETFVSIHETACYFFVINERNKNFFVNPVNPPTNDNETALQCAKRKRIQVHKVDKFASRFAFETPQQAYDHLKWMKQLQLRHIERQALFIKEFFAKSSEDYNDLPIHRYLEEFPNEAVGVQSKLIPNTRELVHEHLVFE